MARRRPASKTVSETDGPTDQKRLGQSKSFFQSGAFEACRGREGQVGIIGRVGDADLRIGRGHGAFRGGDIRTALQKLRGQTDRNGRRRGEQRLDGN